MALEPEHDRREPPENGRRHDAESRARLEEIHNDYVKWGNRSLKILLALAAVLLLFACVDVYLWIKASDNTDQNKANAAAIQRNRVDNAQRLCESQNKKHDDTSNQLIRAAGQDIQNAPTRAARIEIRRRRDVTLGLIDLLAPKQDCDQIVNDLKVVHVGG